MTTEYVLVKVSGPDHPGITSNLMNIIVNGHQKIIDMGQSVTHGFLSLSILLELDSSQHESPVLKELLFEAKKMGLTLDFDLVDMNIAYSSSIDEKFVLNCVSVENITAAFMKDISLLLASNEINILRIDTVSPNQFKSVEITTSLPSGLDWENIKKQLMSISSDHKIDMAFLKDNVYRRNKRLIVFDMDSTLIQTEVIDELAIAHGVGDEIKTVTEQAMNGEMDFDLSLQQRVSKLKGLDQSKLKETLNKLEFTKGAEEFIQTVKSLGYKVALISGGFTYFADAIKEKLDLDYAFANELEIINGKLTGNISGTVINPNQKAILLKFIAQEMKIKLEQVVAIGDGANDLPMLSTAGLGIAYHAKDIVKKKSGHHMSHGPMTTILYFLGIPGSKNI